MTTSAWIMLGITWAVIAFTTIYFFVAVLRRKGE
jgi:ABC-type Co2+ transport system permease subunit